MFQLGTFFSFFLKQTDIFSNFVLLGLIIERFLPPSGDLNRKTDNNTHRNTHRIIIQSSTVFAYCREMYTLRWGSLKRGGTWQRLHVQQLLITSLSLIELFLSCNTCYLRRDSIGIYLIRPVCGVLKVLCEHHMWVTWQGLASTRQRFLSAPEEEEMTSYGPHKASDIPLFLCTGCTWKNSTMVRVFHCISVIETYYCSYF